MVAIDDERDARIASLERLIRDERDRFETEQRRAADDMTELADRLSAVKARNQELEQLNNQLASDLKKCRKELTGFKNSPWHRLSSKLRTLPKHLTRRVNEPAD